MKWRVKDGRLEYLSAGRKWCDAHIEDEENLKWIAERLNEVIEK